MKEPIALKQVHKIQEKIYKETKGMSNKEFLAYVKKNADEVRYLLNRNKSRTKKRRAS